MGFSLPPLSGAVPASSITVGTTTISGGTASGILWNNAGVLASGPATTDSSGNISTAGAGTFGTGGLIVGSRAGIGGAAAGDIVSFSGGRIGFASSTNPFAAPDAYWTRAGVGILALPSGQALQLGNAYVGTPAVGTGTVTIKDSAGVTLRVLVANP